MNLTKSKTAKLVAGFVGFAMAFTLVMPSAASAATAEELQAQINSLLATIQALQAQLAGTTGGTSVATGYTFNTNLTLGSKGTDVLNLQKVLNSSADTQVATIGAGSPGNETSYFGPATKAAVIKFQTKYGITPAAGYVGSITRAKLNSMNTTTGGTTTGGTTTTNPTGGNLTVLAGVQPANSLAPESAARVPFTTITLTAGSSDVTVNSITVEKSGLGQDAAFAGVVAVDSDGLQIGISKTLNSNHQAIVGEPFVIKAGTTKTVTIAGNMASDLDAKAGQVVGLNVVAVNTSATVAGSFPITGAQHTINATLALGAVTIGTSSYDPNSATSQPIGTTGYRFSGFRLTAGSAEDLTFKSIRWNQTGSIGSTDLANVVTYVNGTSYPTTVSTDGKYYTTVFPSGIVVSKGNSVDVYIQGDVVGSSAAGRIAEFDIYKNVDLYLTGNTYGYGIIAPAGSGSVSTAGTHATTINTSSNPWFQGSTLSITAGSVTLIGKATEVAAQNIAVNVANQILGGFATNFSGEPVSVGTMTFTVSTSTATLGNNLITNITVVDSNGAVVAGPVDATWTTSAHTQQTITFTDTVTFPIGRKVYTLKGQIPSTAVNGASITVATTPSTWTSVVGQTTGNSVTISTGAFSMNQMTIKGASMTVNISTNPASQYVVGGIQDFVLAKYQLDATQSGEDLRLSAFPVVIDVTSTVGDLTGCTLWDGTTALNTGSRVVNTVVDNTKMTFSFDNSLTVPKGTIKTLSLTCNVASTPGSTVYQAKADTTDGDYAITGVTSGNSVTVALGNLVLGSANGGIMTVATGSFAVSVDTSTPNYAIAAGGSSGVTVGVVKMRASNEDVKLTKLGLTLTSGASSDVGTVYVYQGSTLLGTATFTGSNTTATSTLNTTYTLTKDTDVLFTVKADLSAIGTGQNGVQGKLVKIDPINAEGTGQSSGNTLQVAATGNTNGIRMFKSFPTISKETLAPTGVADGKLMRFKITANSSGNVGLYKMTFSLATSSFGTGGGVTDVKLYAYTNSDYSTPATTAAGDGQFGSAATPGSGNPATIEFTSTTNALQIPAGSTYYFQLVGTVSSVGDSTSVTTKLFGDAAYIAAAHLGSDYVSTTTGAEADSNNDFIWSGNATSTAVFNANDWANGYYVPGLPLADTLSETRSD